jgi:hypothetical protein
MLRNVPKLVISCAVLHNIAWEVDDGIKNAIDETEENVPVNIFYPNEMRIRHRGQQKQTQISNNLY